MVNGAGAYGVIAALFRPGLVVPNIIVPDISHLNWIDIQKAGVSHVIFDKDNCITKALEDSIVLELQPSWNQCTSLGFPTILIVSNSAGSSSDPLSIGAEHLSRRLGQLVLAHPSKKPSYSCAKQILDFLATRNKEGKVSTPGHIMVVGDRITTDIILASRLDRLLQKQSKGTSQQTIGVLTTKVHSPERLGTRFMRGMETLILNRLIKIGITPGSSWRSKRDLQRLPMDWQSIATGTQMTSSSPSMLNIVNNEKEMISQTPSLPISQRFRQLPSKVTGSIFNFSARSFSWLGAGCHLINDGIHLGTKGAIGSPDPALRRTRLNSNPTSLYLTSTMTSSLSKQSPPSLPTSSRFYSVGKQPHTALPSQRRSRLQGWPGAIAALILLPTCWYAGMVLHEYVEQRRENQLPPPQDDAAAVIDTPSPAFQQSRTNAAPPSLSSQSQQDQAPLTTRHHLQRELLELDEKLQRIEERMKVKENEKKVHLIS